jgi:bacterioferritin-associated ferredoxin
VQQAMGLDESCCGRCEEHLDQMIQDSGVAGCTRS